MQHLFAYWFLLLFFLFFPSFFFFLQSYLLSKRRKRKWSIRSNNSKSSIPNQLASTTVRRYIFVKLRVSVDREMDKVLLKKELEKCFTIKILLFQENSLKDYKEVCFGIFSQNASKHNAKKRIGSILMPFLEPQFLNKPEY